jgi:hypothetical protein
MSSIERRIVQAEQALSMNGETILRIGGIPSANPSG